MSSVKWEVVCFPASSQELAIGAETNVFQD